jgi:SAM-dependent methyltransferase
MNKILDWVDLYKDNFSIKLNGFSEPPILSYCSILPFIDFPGSIIDLGSGNGMLLKFIMDFSRYKITPYGIDNNSDAITMAKNFILPDYSENFEEADYDTCLPFKRIFDIIICNPFHSRRCFYKLVSLLIKSLSPKGKIIIRVHDDVLEKENFDSLEMFCGSTDFPIKFSYGLDVSYGIIYKCDFFGGR